MNKRIDEAITALQKAKSVKTSRAQARALRNVINGLIKALADSKGPGNEDDIIP